MSFVLDVPFMIEVTLGRDIPGLLLVQAKGMFARDKLLLPGLNLFPPGEGQRLHHALDNLGEPSDGAVYIVLAARIAHNPRPGVITILFGLRGDS